jgi:hypothetical protein
VVQLLIEGYLTAQVQQTKYASYAYLIPSPTASRLTRRARKDLAQCGFSIWCYFPIKERKPAKSKKSVPSVEKGPQPQGAATTSRAKHLCPTKRKREEVDDPEDDEDVDVIEISSDAVYEDDEILEANPPPRSRGGRNPLNHDTQEPKARQNVTSVDSDLEEFLISDSGEDNVWTYSHRPHRRQHRRTKSPTMADLSDF